MKNSIIIAAMLVLAGTTTIAFAGENKSCCKKGNKTECTTKGKSCCKSCSSGNCKCSADCCKNGGCKPENCKCEGTCCKK